MKAGWQFMPKIYSTTASRSLTQVVVKMSQLILLFLINKFVDAVNEETTSNLPYKSTFLKIKEDLRKVSNWISNDPSILSEVKTEGPSALSKAKTEDPSPLSKVKTDDPSALSEEKTDDTSAHYKVHADDLRESMYNLDEILRECLMLSKKRKERGKICMNLYSPHELCTLCKFNERLQKIKQYLHGIQNNIPPGLGDFIHGGAPDTNENPLQWTLSAIDETKIYGWDNEVWEINKELIKENTVLNKVGIVGMFGSGKSTLAQKIFVSEKVLDTFPLRLWVWVSPQCEKEELVRRMLDNLGVEEEEIEETLKIDPTKNKLGVLLFILYLQLLDKRYLIVFDDVWNLDGWYCNLQVEPPDDEWDRLAHGLPKGNGSAIIITSRKEDDARKMVGKGMIYTPKPLIGDDGWTLFKSAFEEEVNTLTAEDPKTLTVEWLNLLLKDLVELKQEITIKCGGLPLALITAGKEMAYEKLKKEEDNVRKEMSQYDKNPVKDGAEAEKQKAKASVRDGEHAEKQKPEDTVTGEGSGDGAQAGKQKAEDDHISEEGSSHADRDGAQAQKQNVEEGVAEESSRQTVRDRAQAEKKKEEVERKKAEDAVAEESSGQTVRDRAQAEKKKEAEKKKAEDAVAEEGSGHAVRDGAQAEKQKAEEGSSHAVRDGAQAEKQKADDAVEEGSDHDG